MLRYKTDKFLFLIVLFLLSSCVMHGSNNWNYVPNNFTQNNKKIGKSSIDVIVFTDSRDSEKYNEKVKGLIPFIMKGSSKDPTPELSYDFLSADDITPNGTCFKKTDFGEYNKFRPVMNFASALYSEIMSSNIFNKVTFSCQKYDSRSDYYITGKVLDTSVLDTIYTYGSSILYPLVWMFGVKSDEINVNLKIELSVFNKKGDLLLRKIYNPSSITITNTLYRQNGLMVYNKMIKDAYKEFVTDLSKVIN